MKLKGPTIFLLMQVFFVIFGFALYFGLKELKLSMREQKAAMMIKAESVDESIAVPPAQNEDASCDFPGWVGQAVDENAIKEKGRPYRILPPGSMMTMDYNPARINIHINDKNIVTDITCG